jgi:hypothetical protein
LLGIIGVVLSFVSATVMDCRDGEVLVLMGTVVDKVIQVEEADQAIAPGCPSCGGTPSQGKTSARDVYYVTVETIQEGKPVRHRVEVDVQFYRDIEVGATVELRLVRGKRRGYLCAAPEILLPELIP